MKKFLLSFVLFLMIIQSSNAFDFEVDGIYYNITSASDKTVEVTKKNDDNQNYYGDIIIPSHISFNNIDFTVTSIGYRAFVYQGKDSLNSISIPSSIKEIKKEAFMVYQGRTNNLKVYISDLSAWCKIDFEEDTHSGLWTNPLSRNSSLILNGELVENLIIPSDITEIKPRTFLYYDRLRSVKLHNNVKKIGESAFYGCKNLLNFDASESSLNYIGVYAFRESGLEDIYLNEGLLTIDYFSFQYLDNLKHITLPSTVTEIGRSTFTGCKNLKDIILPPNLAVIKDEMFDGCSSLESVVIDAKVTKIEDNAFSGCSAITSIYCKNHVPPSISANSFTNSPKLFAQLFVPNWSIDSYKSAKGWNEFSNIIGYDFGPCTHNSLTYIPAKLATCSVNGNTEYWICDICGKLFSDSEAKVETSIDAVTSIASHNFNTTPTWEWTGGSSAKATFCCLNEDAIHEEIATITSIVKTNATCEENGTTVYKASIIFNGTEYSDTKEVQDIDALGHNYGEIQWTWSNDCKSASAKIICLHDAAHQISSDAIVTSSVKTEATETSKGITTYTATVYLNGIEYTAIKDVEDIPIKSVIVRGINLSQSTATLKVGETVTLSATVVPSDATNKSISWTSNDTSVATVDSNGKVTAVAEGTATITATANDGSGISESCTVTVKNATVSVIGISLSQSTATLEVGEVINLSATVDPSNATDKSITWTSNNTSVATVDANGKVTAVAEGSATISATANDGSGVSASCKVTVKNATVSVSGISLSQSTATLEVGEVINLFATIDPSNATDKSVSWTSSDTSVATVDANGKVTAVAEGSATISATANDGSGVSASCKVTVKSTDTRATVTFEDPNFEKYCLDNFDTDNDGKLQVEEAEAVESINCGRMDIFSLSGIEYFKNLVVLECYDNKITELYLNNNPLLEGLDCGDNELYVLDVTGCSKLEFLDCNKNYISELDLSTNKSLVYLNVAVNRFASLELNNNKNLEELQCAYNKLNILDVSYSEKLSELGCQDNPLETLYILSTQEFTEFIVPESTKVIYKDTGETGIEKIGDTDTYVSSVYTIDGKPSSLTNKGLNIIRSKDGKPKKVIIK